MDRASSDVTVEAATWYVDGSLLHARVPDLATAGGGIVVLNHTERSIHCAQVRLPTKVRTAAAAEAWTLQVVLAMCPTPPKTITDCLSLLATAERGPQRATAASRPLGGVWRRIAASVDGDTASLVHTRRLVWMPSHATLAAATALCKSDGTFVTTSDWRANRLCDAHAKLAAGAAAPDPSDVQAVKLGMRLARLQAAVVGATTYAANHHVVETLTRSGEIGRTVMRDAVAPVRAVQRAYGPRRATPATAVAAPVEPPTDEPTAFGLRERSRSPRHAWARARAAGRAVHVRQRSAQASFVLAEALRLRHSSGSPQPQADDARLRRIAGSLAHSIEASASEAMPHAPATPKVPLPPPARAPSLARGPPAPSDDAPAAPAVRAPPAATAVPPRLAGPVVGLAALVALHSRAYRAPKAAPSTGPAMRLPPPARRAP